LQFTANKNKILKLNDGFIFVIVIFFALLLRTFELDNRPLHTDEAVHAVKFGELLENGNYQYDPIEYHGPTLNYFTLITAALFGEETFADLNEYTLRLVPALISFIIILLFFTFRKEFGSISILIATFISVSPEFVFYSRYYIQETLFVTFTYSAIVSFYKYFLTKKKTWILFSAIFTALTFATKETSIIVFFASTVSSVMIYLFYPVMRPKLHVRKFDLLVFSATTLIISILFYSSFFTNPSGITDSILTFSNYFNKAGANVDHIKPWYYYFDLLLFTNNDLIIFTQFPLFIFTIFGFYFSFFGSKKSGQYFFQFISIYSMTQALVYAIIPYKTPWLLLNFWIGFIIVASFGIYNLYGILNNRNFKILFIILIGIILSHNVFQTYITSFAYPYQAENPFTYSQSTLKIVEVSDKIINVAIANPNDTDVMINVIAEDNDYWPLPWYLRKLKNVAWNNHVTNSVYQFPIIIATPGFEDEIINNVYNSPPPGERNLYVPLFEENTFLRPHIEIRGYVQKDLYDYYLRSATDDLIE
jgi:uncharacterized protein (TIGR03663 family)